MRIFVGDTELLDPHTYSFGADHFMKFQISERMAAGYNKVAQIFVEAEKLFPHNSIARDGYAQAEIAYCVTDEDLQLYEDFGKIVKEAIDEVEWPEVGFADTIETYLLVRNH